MTAPAKESDQQSLGTSWIYQHLIFRRTLPLAALMLWGGLSMMDMIVHPPSSNSSQSVAPFMTASGTGIDYYQFWLVGRARPLRLDNIYANQNRQRMAALGWQILKSSPAPSDRLAGVLQVRGQIIQTFSTPFLYSVISLFTSAHYDRDFERFLEICLSSTVLSVVVMGWILGYTLAESLMFVTATLLWSVPIASDLRVGNVNQLQLAGVALYLLLRCRADHLATDLLSGLTLGFLVAFKPTLGVIAMLLAITWVIDRRWTTLFRQSSAAVVGAGLAILVGSIFLNSAWAWLDWLHGLSDLETVPDISVQMGNFSLSQVIIDSTRGSGGRGISVAPILLAAVIVVFGIALARTSPVVRGTVVDSKIYKERDFLVTAIGCAVSVVALKLVWLHYYVLLIPLLMYLLRPGGWMPRQTIATDNPKLPIPLTGFVLSLLALMALLGWPLNYLLQSGPVLQVAIYIGGAWCLTLLGIAGLRFPTTRL